MKAFDPESIQNRLITALKQEGDWKRIIEDSAVVSFLKTIAEGNSEMARYFEYLLRESRWDLAKNSSSLISLAPYLGYKPKRKTSSIGYVYISHDVNLQNAGSSLFTEEDLSALTPYSGNDIPIPMGTKVTDGVRTFITTQEVTYTPFIEGQAVRYIKVPIIQGIQQSSTSTYKSAGIAFESIRIIDSAVEDASDEVSSKFLVVFGYLGGNEASEPLIFTKKEDIHLADSAEYAYDINTASDFQSVTIRFGDGFSGRILPKDTLIRVNYLRSLGADSDQSENFTIESFIVDSNSKISSLYVTNFSPCLGGRDEDSIEDIRGKAPTQYLLEGSIITEEAYKKSIESIPSIAKATIYSGVGKDASLVWKDLIRYSAISVLGQSPDRTFIEEAVLSRLLTKKSPLDILVYDEPKFVRLKVGVVGNVGAKESNITALETLSKSIIYDKYNIFAVDFQAGFDGSSLVTDIGKQIPVLSGIAPMVEAYERLAPSTFASTAGGTIFEKRFSFDRSFTGTKGFRDGKKYLVKLDILFNCAECQANKRTLFILEDQVSGYRVAQFEYITSITNSDYMESRILALNTNPQEIVPGDDAYIPISIILDDITKNTWTGTVSIPLKKNATEDYINFKTLDKVALDETVLIDISCEPRSMNIFLRELDDEDHPQKNRIIGINEDDIKIELSYL